MKKWMLLFSILLSVFTAAAYTESIEQHEIDSWEYGNEDLYDEAFFAQEGPLPLPDDPGQPPLPPPPNGKPMSYTVGSAQTSRFGSRSFTFYTRPTLQKTTKLRIVALRNNINVSGVWLSYADSSESRSVREFQGELSTGRAREIKLSGRPLLRVDVEASAGYFWKQPGSFRVEATGVP